jgi:hypothetical protein
MRVANPRCRFDVYKVSPVQIVCALAKQAHGSISWLLDAVNVQPPSAWVEILCNCRWERLDLFRMLVANVWR